MNRAQRRSSDRRTVRPMAKNGKSVTTREQMFRRPLPQPEQAGTIGVGEAAEIRERNRLIEQQQKAVKAKQDEANDAAKMLTLLRMESGSFLQSLCRERGLNLDDTYNVESESGIIWRTAIGVPESEMAIKEVPAETVAQEG